MRREGYWSFKYPEIHFHDSREVKGDNKNGSPSSWSTPLRSEVAVSNQNTDPWYLDDRVLFAHSGSSKLHASCAQAAPGT